MMWKYGTKTIAHDFFVDKTMYAHRNLTVKESVDIVRRHALFAKSINCPVMRIGGQVDPEVFRQSVPILEDLGVKMGLEIHSGSSSFCLPQVQDVIEVIRQSGSKYIGIVPDMSMFCKEVSQSQLALARSEGVDEKLVEEVENLYKQVDNVQFRSFCNEQMELAKDEATKGFLARIRRTEYYDPKVLLEYMPYIIHCHGKFYEMTEDCEESTIDYPGILNVLVEGGYDGYISAEYEGRPINGDTFEPFRRYQKMLDKYLGHYPEANYPEWPNAEPVKGGGFGVPNQALLPKGFQNHYENGECTGFEVQVSSYYYRGVPLSLFESCYVEVNGKMYGPESMRVKVDGETFRFKDMCDVTLHYWNKGYPATIIIDEPGGLEVGKEYRVSAVVTIRAYYMREGIAAQLAGTQVKMPSAEKRILIHNSFYLIRCNSVSDKADDYGKIWKMLKELARHCLIKKDCDLKTYYNQMQNRCYNPDMMTWYDNQMHWYKYLIDELTEETRYHTPEIALQASLLADGIFLSQQEGRSVAAEEIKEKSQSLAIWHQETPWGIFDYDSQI